MPLKINFYYNQGNEGWSETYYANGSNPQQYATTNFTSANLTPFIMPIRATGVTFFEARVSLLGSPRTTFSLVQGQLPQNTDDLAPTLADVAAVDALIQLNAFLGLRPRHLWIRGLPDSFVTYDAALNPNPPAALISAITQMVNAMIRMGFCIQNASVPAPTSGSWYKVLSIDKNPDGSPTSIVTVTPTLIGAVQGNPIYFQGLDKNLLPGFPRQMIGSNQVTGPPSTLTLPYLFRAPTSPFSPKKLKFFVLADLYNTITSAGFLRYGTHKTGRPFGVPRGRSPVGTKRQ